MLSMKEMKYVISLLETIPASEGNDNDRSLAEIKECCRNFFPPHGGLSDYFIWRDDLTERKRINKIQDGYKNKIWLLLKL